MNEPTVHFISQAGPFATLCGPAKGPSASIRATAKPDEVNCSICLRKMPDATLSALRREHENEKATPTVEMKQTTIRQRRGPAIRFTGAVIAKTEYITHRGDEMRLEVYQTAGGALIAVSVSEQETRADVIEPGNEVDMHCAVMDAFDWNDRARSMLRDQLKWKFVREVP